MPAPQQKVVVNVGTKAKDNSGCGCLVLIVLGVIIWGCAGGFHGCSDSYPTTTAPVGPVPSPPTSRPAPIQPLSPADKARLRERDAKYERDIPADQRVRDGGWWSTRQSVIAAGGTAEDGEAKADKLYGHPSRAWPIGYFDRNAPPASQPATHLSKDEVYDATVSAEQRELDRRWWHRFKQLIAEGHSADQAGNDATEEVGSSSNAWPPGYFDRHP